MAAVELTLAQDLEVRRRYSEFESLRNNLALLYPCLIVPPIPEKHTFSDYATAPRLAKEDVTMIDLRKRMLGVFLNRCLRMKEIRRGTVFAKFLDPNASWVGKRYLSLYSFLRSLIIGVERGFALTADIYSSKITFESTSQ